jgi:hypothetical protein
MSLQLHLIVTAHVLNSLGTSVLQISLKNLSLLSESQTGLSS